VRVLATHSIRQFPFTSPPVRHGVPSGSARALHSTARLHNRLVYLHNIDHVINDEHNGIIIVVLAKHEIAP